MTERALPAQDAARGSPLTIGTAGHVDHGKTALVAALSGVDTDRLPEEKTRGLSIVLGYAPLRLPSGRSLSLVDVPGHERFVRTMVAGATGVDAFLMTVAADDGVMPQTREHAEVLHGLGVTRGLVAVTKADLADPRRAREQAQRLLPGLPVVECSVRTGAGVEQVRAALERLASSLPSRAQAQGGPRLHVDRVFTVRGRGTVVTGTLWSGTIGRDDTLEVVPRRLTATVRSVEVHDEEVDRAAAGQRVAVNLRGVGTDQVARGDVLAQLGVMGERTVLDCQLRLSDARNGERVQVHHGTRDVPGRLCTLGGDLWQLRLERPLLAGDGERLIVRRHAPAQTLGGGTILDAAAVRHGRRQAVALRQGGARDGAAVGRAEAAGRHLRTPRGPNPALTAAIEERLRLAGRALVSEAQLEQDMPDAAPTDIAMALRALREAGQILRVSGRLYAHSSVVEDARRRVVALIERDGPVTLAQARDELAVGRKTAQALLDHLDAAHVTRRLQDDRRALVRSGAAATPAPALPGPAAATPGPALPRPADASPALVGEAGSR